MENLSTKIVITLTQGNINNNHFYLRYSSNLFPPDSIGGSNKTESGKQLTLHVYGFHETIKTDIAGDKMIFRKRDWVGRFFKANQLKQGDKIVVERTSEYEYNIYPQ